ncbi:MAG: heterodisulfide reductase-related iron-sulfur binding cluster [candidate division WOR-3 bacterium]
MADLKSAGRKLIFVCSRVNIPGFGGQERVTVKPVSCIGQVGAGAILEALAAGMEGVTLVGCPDGSCRHEKGTEIAHTQVKLVQELLRQLGFAPELVRFISGDPLTAVEPAADFRSVPAVTEEISVPPAGFGPADFVCLDCGRCAGVCPVARTGIGFSPRRLIQQQLEGQGRVSTRALYACIGCDLCSTVCPSGRSFARTVERLRAVAYEHGSAPVLAHGGIVQALGRIQARSAVRQQRLLWLKPELQVADKGETALFTGCLPYFQVLFADLGVNLLQTASNAIALLNQAGVVPVLLQDEVCCGHDLLWLGDRQNALRLARKNVELLKSAGVRRVVFLCPECLHTFRVEYPELVGPTGLELLHISEFLVAAGWKPPEREKESVSCRTVTYQDPCRLGRQLGVYDAPRQLITGISGMKLVEMAHSRSQALCCGGTQWLECGAAVRLLQERRLAEAQATGAELLVTACPRCDIHLACARQRNAESEIKILNLIDLLNYEG